jgi:hypothetical protein
MSSRPPPSSKQKQVGEREPDVRRPDSGLGDRDEKACCHASSLIIQRPPKLASQASTRQTPIVDTTTTIKSIMEGALGTILYIRYV